MIRRLPVASSLASLVILLALAGTSAAEAPALAAQRFEPGDVKLLDGPYKHALEQDAKFLRDIDPDRLLAWYRKEAGLEPKAEVYGGWESRGLAGHCLGHYLSGCARMYRATGDEEFKRRVDFVVRQLDECQQAGKDGFLGAMPNGRRVFEEVSRGEIRSAGFDLNGAWVPWYNLHKLFAGLIDSYRYCDNEQAKTVVCKLADWAIHATKNLNEAQWQQMLACEHGGMNESLAELSAIADNPAYMELAHKFYHRAILDGLAEGRDTLGGKHANTQIPKAIGAATIYALTGEEKFGKISTVFWDTVIHHHTYVTGGNSDGEHFGAPDQLNDRLSNSTTETCNVYNMLKLTAALFERDPKPEYAEYAERALWNHILGSRHPESGQVCYFLTLKPGATREYKGDYEFTCCNGSGMETPVRTADYIYFHHGAEQVWVNQFIPSEVTWKAAGVTLRQETKFPAEPSTQVTVSCAKPTTFKLHFRHPKWVAGPLAITINGEKVDVTSSPGGYATIEREWKDVDTLSVELPMTLHTESMPDNLKRIAVFNGPILLAGNLSGGEGDDRVPVLVTNNEAVDDWVSPAKEDSSLDFRTEDVGRPRDVPLVPFYDAHDFPATVYFDEFDDAQWTARQAEYEAQKKRDAELAARTVDHFLIGEMQPERDHNVQGEKSDVGQFNGRALRHAWDGGWFSCELKVPKDGPAEMVVDYWGSETGDREFDVLVEGEVIDTTSLHQDAPEKFWEKTYPLPAELIAGKEKVTVRFQAKPGNFAGGVFGIRVMRPE